MFAGIIFEILIVEDRLLALVVDDKIGVDAAKAFFGVFLERTRAEGFGIDDGFHSVVHMIEKRDCAGGIGSNYDAGFLSSVFNVQRRRTGVEEAPLATINQVLSVGKFVSWRRGLHMRR